MDAKELRIGNYVYAQSGKLVANRDSIYKVENVNIQSARKYEPIPLTEEWLLKFGFTSFGLRYSHDHLPFDIIKGNGFYMANITPEITTLNQLQNLYFALTGEELQLK